MAFDFPSNNTFVDDDKSITPSWLAYFSRLHAVISSLTESGPTAQRPVKGLWIGRGYFDTTLGIKIFVKFASPNPAATVWVNGAGTAV
jgi:hypothetical protein